MLDDDHRRVDELENRLPGGIGVHDVDVREVEPVQLLGVDDAPPGQADPLLAVEGGLLVGVLPVAQLQGLVQGHGHSLGERTLVPAQVLDDGGVVVRGVLERLLGQATAELQGNAAGVSLSRPHAVKRLGVVSRVDEDEDEGIVLGGGADDGRPADVDLLQALVVAGAGGHRLDEGVEVHADQVYGGDVTAPQVLHVLGHVPAGQDAAVEDGMDALDATAQYLREACEG